jgi:flavin reductase (DIM6/NTAB) family NADH-FMN oxidoreductase RutF
MRIDAKSTNVIDVYHLLVGLVAPRPIAWVSTLSPSGVVNLAPFSFFNAFGANPPVVVFSPTLKRDGGKKDTLINVEANGEFVVNGATERHAEAINMTSRSLPADESEVTFAGLKTAPSERVKPPRVVEAPFALECQVIKIMPIGGGPIAANLVIGEVVMIHVDDRALDSAGRPDPRKLKSIARLGGEYWCRTEALFELPRPG